MSGIDKLIEAVEAGRGFRSDIWTLAWEAFHKRRLTSWVVRAWDGDLNADMRLHVALLPEWRWNLWAIGGSTVWTSAKNTFSADVDDPARSFLLAILKAYRSRQ